MTSSTPTTASTVALAGIERAVGGWCDQTDPALFTGSDAVVAVERLARVVRRLTAKQAAFAERVDACRAHPKQAGSPEDWLARQNGTSRGEAKKAIDTVRRTKTCPATAEAFANGDLSLGEADAISAAAAVDPAAEAELVAKAKRSHDLADTKERAAKVRAAAHKGEDSDTRRKRLRAKRRWSEFDEDEMRAVAARFLPEEWAAVAPVVDAFANAIFDEARRQGIHDPIEAYRADAVLAALAAAGETLGLDLMPKPETATATTAPAAESAEPQDTNEPVDLLKVRPCRAKWNVTVLVDAIALQRGYATASETCEIVGVGPVDVDWINQILPTALVDVLVHDLVDITASATTTRYRTRALDKALQARDRRCVVPGCKRRRRLQADHRHDYAKGGPTSGANCELLCEIHHKEKTHRGARIERTTAEWLWFPPAPKPGEPDPAPGSIPWRGPIGEHLTGFDLTDLPDPDRRPGAQPPDVDPPDPTLPFG